MYCRCVVLCSDGGGDFDSGTNDAGAVFGDRAHMRHDTVNALHGGGVIGSIMHDTDSSDALHDVGTDGAERQTHSAILVAGADEGGSVIIRQARGGSDGSEVSTLVLPGFNGEE